MTKAPSNGLLKLAWAVEQAAASQVMLAVEIMDTAFMNSISKWKKWDEMLASPWFTVYPDVATSAPGAMMFPPN